MCLRQVFVVVCLCFYVGAADDVGNGKVCVTAQNLFTERNTEFERCTMKSAVADNFCLKCLVFYVEQLNAYKALMETRDTSTENTNKLCGDEVTEEDHFNILQTHFARSKDVWNRARCTKCFDCDPEKIPSNDNITTLCTVKASVAGLQDSTSTAQSCFTNTQENVCKDCANLYEAMMAKYKLLKSVSGGDLCFDVKDAVDRTRQMWHKDKCDPATSSGWSFTSFLLLFLAAGAVSYGSFRSYRMYRFRRDYLTTAMANSADSNNFSLLEERHNDSEL